MAHAKRLLPWGALSAIVLAAAFFRLYQIDVLPPGLHHDEAFQGVMAMEVIRGIQRPVFFPGNFGNEPANIYLNALAFLLLGPQAPLMRIVSALVGLLTIPVTCAAARELFHDEGEWRSWAVGLLSAAGLAILYWHVNFSRQGIQPILAPLVLTLFSVLLWRGLRTGRLTTFALSGATVGVLPYTYAATRVFPLLPALFLGLRILLEQSFWKRYRHGLIAALITAIIVIVPLARFALEHPDLYFLRSTQVYSLGNELANPRFLDHTLKVAGALFWEGDQDQRNNLPGRPALDPLMALPFAIGLISSLVHWRQPRHSYLLLWLVVGLLPTLLTDYPPHFRRAIASTVPLVILVAWGWLQLADSVKRLAHGPFSTLMAWAPIPATFLLFIISGWLTYRDYFLVWGRNPGLFYAYDVGLVQIAERINHLDDPSAEVWRGTPNAARLTNLPADAPVYLSPTDANHPTLTFFRYTSRPVKSYDGRHALVIPPPNQQAVYVTITHEDQRSEQQYQRLGGQFFTIAELRDNFNELYATFRLRIPGSEAIQPQFPLSATLSDTIRFLGYDATDAIGSAAPRLLPGQSFLMTLYWQALSKPLADYTVFIQVIGPTNPASGSPVWAQTDNQPGQRSYPTSRWSPGETILDSHLLTIPAQLPSGTYELIAGLYLLQTLERLPAYDAKGDPLPDQRILLQRWTIP